MAANLLDDFSKLDGHQDDTAFDALQEYTDNGKELVWTGRPRQGVILRKSDWFMIPFSILWGGFAIGWEIGVIAMGAGALFALWGIPFVVVGLYLIIGRFFHDAWYRARTFYGLTNDRLFIKRPKKIEEIYLADMRSLDMKEEGNNRGTLSFDTNNIGTKSKQMPAIPAMGNVLDSVANADEAYTIIQQHRKAQRTASSSIDFSGKA